MSKKQKIKFKVTSGRPLPLGATLVPGGCRFSVFSRHATGVWLQLYEKAEDKKCAAEFELDPELNRTGDIWHVDLEGIEEGQLYLWRVDGPDEPERGHRFNPEIPLLDPYAKALTGNYAWEAGRSALSGSEKGSNSAYSFLKCIVLSDDFDWQGDRPLRTPPEDSIIYELHVRGFTNHPSSGVTHPGTFQGLIEKIDYLKELGVTAVELLPVHEFNENELIRTSPLTGERLKNYWGYSSVLFSAPQKSYASGDPSPGAQVREFKTMVRAFHSAGLEVILDVVFNHTAEGDHTGPTLSFRGLDNTIYYLLDEKDPSLYKNFSGCGNTMNCNHPVVRKLIRDALRYWVIEMHVDGFRFDLASILGRDRHGNMLENPPLVESIAEDPILRHVKIIAEAWDAAGAYQVGSFPGGRWSEWNGRYRDDVRRFWRGEHFSRNALATRITGSSDLYQPSGKLPRHSINFITSHDGFTLNDLVSYNEKHNEANGEDNRDGDNQNLCFNFGVEGPSEDPRIKKLRLRQVKSFLATLLLSQGVPMMLSGDEIRRTQKGNNNAYCQDNEISWNDWRLLEQNRCLFEFTKSLIAFRKGHPAFRRRSFLTGIDLDGDSMADIEWFEPGGEPTRWNSKRPVLACYLSGSRIETGNHEGDYDFYLMFNAGRRCHLFKLPALPGRKIWRRVLDTSIEGPDSIFAPGTERPQLEDQSSYQVEGHTCVLVAAGTRRS
ncbi:MAG TPA: glycogen debranching protein GlgX [archaeon]|nr:glycogen debranching protein GlgX [archaeon]